MQHRSQAQHEAGAFQLRGIGVLGGVHVGNGVGQRAVVAQTAGEHERRSAYDAFVEHAAAQLAALDGGAYAARAIDRVDGAHVIAVAVLLLAAVAEAHAKGGAEERGLDIVHAQRVAAQHAVNPAAADERGQPGNPAGVDDDRPGHGEHFEFLLDGLANQRCRLADGGLHLALGADAVGHEGEFQAIALFGFRSHADAAHPDHDAVAPAEIAQAAAGCAAVADYDHGVHALVFDLDPLVAEAHVSLVVGGGVEILGRATVAFHGGQRGVAGVDRRAADHEQIFQEAVERGAVRRLHFQAQVGRFGIGASDAELFYFEAAVVFDDLIEDVLDDVRVDEVAFGLHDFLK